MTHDAITLLMLVVMMFLPLLYGAVFCRREAPMKRLVIWTEAASEVAVAVIRLLLRK
jgi:hypothetical protein